jgi:hypothetical protein
MFPPNSPQKLAVCFASASTGAWPLPSRRRGFPDVRGRRLIAKRRRLWCLKHQAFEKRNGAGAHRAGNGQNEKSLQKIHRATP